MRLNIQSMPQAIEVESEHSALVVVDMQNGFCKKEGLFGALGILDKEKMEAVIQNDIRAIAAARAKEMNVVYLRMGYNPEMADTGGPDSPNYWKEGSLVELRRHPELRESCLTYRKLGLANYR